MSDTDTTSTAGETSADTTSTEAESTTDTTTKPDGTESLGDAGKKALDAMKAKWKDAEAKVKTEADARAALQAKLDGKEAEFTAAQEAQRIKDEALSAANQRILKSEVKAAAKGVLADPQDAYKFLNLDSFEVDSDGNVDESAITTALTDLISQKPYLAAQSKRFQGGADGGARNDATTVGQLTEADVKRLSSEGKHDEIVKAREEGRLRDYLASP